MRLLALIDVLRDDTLSASQKKTVQGLRAGILALMEGDDELTSDTGDDELQSPLDDP